MGDCLHCPARLDSIFSELPEPTLNEISKNKTTNFYERGQKIFNEGNPPMGLFCISYGKVKLWKSGIEGNEVIIRLYQGGEVLGYRSLLSGEPYGGTAEALEETKVCFLDGHVFTTLIAGHPDLAFRIIHRLSEELGEAQNRIRDSVNKTVRQRLGETLLALQRVHGEPANGGTLLKVSLTRGELASMIGTTPETAIRTLSDFRREGLVELDGKKIIVADVEGLAAASGLDF